MAGKSAITAQLPVAVTHHSLLPSLALPCVAVAQPVSASSAIAELYSCSGASFFNLTQNRLVGMMNEAWPGGFLSSLSAGLRAAHTQRVSLPVCDRA